MSTDQQHEEESKFDTLCRELDEYWARRHPLQSDTAWQVHKMSEGRARREARTAIDQVSTYKRLGDIQSEKIQKLEAALSDYRELAHELLVVTEQPELQGKIQRWQRIKRATDDTMQRANSSATAA